MTGTTLITGGRVITPQAILEDASVLIEHGRIAAVGPALERVGGA